MTGFWCGLQNLWIWLPIIWSDRNYDWYYLVRILDTKLRIMADCFERHGYHVHADRDAKRMRLCAALCRRMLKDDYITLSGWMKYYKKDAPVNRYVSPRERRSLQHIEYLERQDMEMLGKLLGKHLRSWWD